MRRLTRSTLTIPARAVVVVVGPVTHSELDYRSGLLTLSATLRLNVGHGRQAMLAFVWR